MDPPFGSGWVRLSKYRFRGPFRKSQKYWPLAIGFVGFDSRHAIGKGQILALQQGVKEAAHFYRYYAEVTDGYKRDPLLEGRFPDGGATVSEGERKT